MNGREPEDIVEIKCINCDKSLYMFRSYVREKMFCTLGCLEEYKKKTDRMI